MLTELIYQTLCEGGMSFALALRRKMNVAKGRGRGRGAGRGARGRGQGGGVDEFKRGVGAKKA